MFTGMVTEMGSVRKSQRRGDSLDLEIEAGPIVRELKRGDSIAVNGACLTATATGRRKFSCQVTSETLARTTLGTLKRGARVNLELPVRVSDRLGGHLVQGHVDATAKVLRVEEDAIARRVWFEAPEDTLRYLVSKGSVAVDGVSLTVVEVGRTTFQVALIPHTLEITTLRNVAVGSVANVEVDVLAKYVERLMEGRRR